MYQLNTAEEWDTDYFHTLMSEKRIFSSKEAKDIRAKLIVEGALPHLNNNFDWAMLCIGYSLAKGFAEHTQHLVPAPAAQGGIEIPSFQTCFQEHARLWLVILSDTLFKLHPDKALSKDDLYQLIQTLWHTGAVSLERFWEDCKRFKREDHLAARQAFLNELAEIAVKNAGIGFSDGLNNNSDGPKQPENQEPRLRRAFERLNIPVSELSFLHSGARYDIYRLRLSRYTAPDRHHPGLCSELGIQSEALHIVPCHNGESHAYDLKLLRDEKHWHKLGAQKFAQALESYNADYALPVCLGIDEYGRPRFADLAQAPHLMIGGTTGSGKSVFVRTLLRSLFDLNKGQDKMEVAILDPKKVDYLVFENEEDLWDEHIIDDYEEMYQLLTDTVAEAENRYLLMKHYGVQKLAQLPEFVRPRYRVIVIDELANLKKQHEGIEAQLIRLAEKARASGIHLILSTQRPDAQTFNGTLRSNLPSRIALKVQKATESKIILDETGAEKLLGKGDHLVKWNSEPVFLHGFDL